MVAFGFFLPSSTKKKKKKQKNVVKVGPPLAKLSGSAHVQYIMKSCLFDLMLRQQIPNDAVNEEKCHSQGYNIFQRLYQEIQTCVNKITSGYKQEIQQ